MRCAKFSDEVHVVKLREKQKNFQAVLEPAFVQQFTAFHGTVYEQ